MCVCVCVCVCVCACVCVCGEVSEAKCLNPFKVGHLLNIKYSSINHDQTICQFRGFIGFTLFNPTGHTHTHTHTHITHTHTHTHTSHTHQAKEGFGSFHVKAGPIKMQNLPVVCHIETDKQGHTHTHTHTHRHRHTHSNTHRQTHTDTHTHRHTHTYIYFSLRAQL